MGDPALLNLLSVVISAVITAAGTVIAAYISRGKEKKAEPQKGKILLPPGYGSETKRFWNIRSIVIITFALIGIAIAARWLLGEIALKNTTSERLEFVSTNDSAALNPNLGWEAGSSTLSSFSLEGRTLNLTTGPYTWPNFPEIYYKEPVTGNFEVQVKVDFEPEASVLVSAQMVGLLVRPMGAHLVQGDPSFPMDWVVAGRSINDAGSLVGCRGSWPDYSSNLVYLKLERGADSWRCAYSENGENWIWLNANVEDALLRDKQFVISLFAYSDTDKPVTVKFSDWAINRDQ